MELNREHIRDSVIECIREMVDGRTEAIDEQTNPIRSFGLDSLDGLDFACALSKRLDYHIPDDVNPFVDDTKNRARRVGEIVDLLCKLTTAPQEVLHGR